MTQYLLAIVIKVDVVKRSLILCACWERIFFFFFISSSSSSFFFFFFFF